MHAETVINVQQVKGFQTARLSETGGRQNNEDFCDFLQIDNSACWVVADGLGAHNGGEVASRTAVESLLKSFCTNPEISCSALEGHISAAQDAIVKTQQEDSTMADMRTTLVTLISDSHSVLWAHVGDSRLYRFQMRGLVAQTEDHSVPQALVKAGDISLGQIRGHADRNKVLRSVGERGQARPAILPMPAPLCESDAFLLCTDGFWEHIFEIEMLVDLAASASPLEWLKRGESRLLRRVNGDYDNYSALAIFYETARTSQGDDV